MPGQQTWTTTYDDAASLQPKYELAKAAGWGGVGFWQADGMWPYPYLSNISIYCKEEMDAQWEAVRAVWN
jgi:GH18 family chitinase